MQLRSTVWWLFFALGAVSFAQASEPSDVLKLTGEVFLKGSIDGKKMFMVLGVKDALDMDKDIARWAIKGEDLQDLAYHVNNPDHRLDVVGSVRNGAETAQFIGKHILSVPWKSLQQIPQAYEVNFDRASDAYYGSENPTVGVLKYAGWAVWANVEGAYYLIIEAPVEFAGLTFATVAAVPTAVGIQGIIIAWHGLKIVFKYTVGAVSAAAISTYSVITASTATVCSLVAAGGIAVYRGGKWLVYELPRNIIYPVDAVVDIETLQSYLDQEAMARSLLAFLLANGRESGIVSVTHKIKKYTSQFSLNGEVAGKKVVTATVSIGAKKGKVYVRVEAPRSYAKAKRAAMAGWTEAKAKTWVAAETFAIAHRLETHLTAKVTPPARVANGR